MSKRLVVVLAFLISACGSEGGLSADEDGFGRSANAQNAGTAPVIKSLPISIEDYDSDTQMAGDVDFTHNELGSTDKIFLEFNGLLIDGGTPPEGVRLPHFTFNLPQGTPIYAMSDGVVKSVEENSNHPDLEIIISPDATSGYQMIYDHVLNPTVSAGDTVVAGQKIGETSATKFEADVSINSTAYCPVDYFDPAVKDELVSKISGLIADWEDYKGDTSIYDEAQAYDTGCFSETGDL